MNIAAQTRLRSELPGNDVIMCYHNGLESTAI